MEVLSIVFFSFYIRPDIVYTFQDYYCKMNLDDEQQLLFDLRLIFGDNEVVLLGDVLTYIMHSAAHGNPRRCRLFYTALFNYFKLFEDTYEVEKIEIVFNTRKRSNGKPKYMIYGNPQYHIHNVIRDQYVDTSLEVQEIDVNLLSYHLANELLIHCSNDMLNTILYQP